jgi:integrase
MTYRGVLTHTVLVRRLAQKLAHTPERMDQALDAVYDTITKNLLGGGMVLIDGFGGFGPLNLTPTKRKGGAMAYFHPAKVLVDRINATPPRERARTPARRTSLGRPPVRPEDDALINRWLAIRRPINLRSTRDVLYGPKIERPLSDESRFNQGKTLRTFARRIPVPLAKLGLTTVHGTPIIALEIARDQVAAYAELFRAKAVERWKTIHPELAAHPEWTVPAWRTYGWVRLVTWGNQFYAWLEEEGIRPANTNPFAGVRRFRVFLPKRIRPIVKEWFDRLLRYKAMTPRERVIIFLLANGLRRVEVTRLRLEHLDLPNRQIIVLGKGNARELDPRPKVRTVPLLPWTLTALDAYLADRHDSTNPLLFHTRVNTPLQVVRVGQIFADVLDRVFFTEDDAQIRREITPHALRRYFVTEALRRGVQVNALMRATGHTTLSSLAPYIGLVDSDVRTEFARVSAEPWF